MGFRSIITAESVLLRGGQKSVLMALAYHADDTTNRSSPSIDSIVAFTGLTRAWVFHTLNALEGAGWITRHSQPGKRNTYDLHLTRERERESA